MGTLAAPTSIGTDVETPSEMPQWGCRTSRSATGSNPTLLGAPYQLAGLQGRLRALSMSPPSSQPLPSLPQPHPPSPAPHTLVVTVALRTPDVFTHSAAVIYTHIHTRAWARAPAPCQALLDSRPTGNI